MYYLVYKTTNLINGKYYIGCHQTSNKTDTYIGSGTLLKRAIKKYGKENFKKEIIFEASSPEEMFSKEKSLVHIGPDTYNLKSGGEGGWDHLNTPDKINQRRKSLSDWGKIGIRTIQRKYKDDSKFAEQFRENARKAAIFARIACIGRQGTFRNKRHTEETKQKMSQAKIGKNLNEKNSQFGTIWICNSITRQNMKIKKDQIIPIGWVKGRL